VDEYVFLWAFGEMKLREAFQMRFWNEKEQAADNCIRILPKRRRG
jgi:hypothetical protein